MSSTHRRLPIAAAIALATVLVLATVARVDAVTPVNDTSTAGVHILTVPSTPFPGYGTGAAVGIADNGWVALTTGLWQGAGYPTYEVGPIPIPTNPQFTVTAVGADGTLAGNYVYTGSGAKRGFVRYPDGTLEDLVPPGYAGSLDVTPSGISDEGHIVGRYYTFGDVCGPTTAGYCSFIATPGAGGYDIEPLPAMPSETAVFALSVGGHSSTTGIIVGGPGWTWTAAGGYLTLDGGPTAIAGGAAYDINTNGEIAGYFIPVNGITQAAYWADRTQTAVAISRLGADTNNFAWAINDLGQVVGWSGPSSGTSGRKAFVWDSTIGTTALGQLPGGSASEANGITENGLVAGNADGKAVIWDLDDDFDIDYPPDLVSYGGGVTTILEGDLLSLQIGLTDYEGDPFDVTIDDLSVNAAFDTTTGTLEWQTAPGDAGSYSAHLTATQQGLSANSFSFQLPPVTVVEPLVMQPIDDRGTNWGIQQVIEPVVTGGTSVSYSAFGGTPTAQTALPEGASISSTTGVLTWTPTIEQIGDHEITIRATDSGPISQTASSTFTISVFDAVQISISESVGITDAVAVRPPIAITISENIAVTDTVTVRPPITITISENVGVDDTVATDAQSYPTLAGTVWSDIDGDGVRDTAEPRLSGVVVYADLNRNGVRNTGEPSATTVFSGDYTIIMAPSAFFDVRAVMPTGYALTRPVGAYSSKVDFDDTVVGLDFGFDPIGVDTDGDSIVDAIDGSSDKSTFTSRWNTDSTQFTDRHRAGPSGRGTTSGQIDANNGLNLTIKDAANITDGITVSAPVTPVGTADFTFCDTYPDVSIRAGTTATFTCGSLLIEVETGTVTVTTDDGDTIVVGAGDKVLIDEDSPGGIITVLEGTISITSDGVTTDYSADDPTFSSISPVRLVETRSGEKFQTIDDLFEGDGTIRADTVYEVDIAGRGDIAPNTTAAVLNLTTVAPVAAGFLTIYPCGDRPKASGINFTAGAVVNNEIIAKLSPTGSLCIYASAETHLVIDAVGSAPITSPYVAIDPARIVETRIGDRFQTADDKFEGDGTIATGETYRVKIAGRGGIAPDAAAAVLNLTTVGPLAPGFLTVFPCGTQPKASGINYATGAVVNNEIITKLSATGEICIFASAETHVVIDAAGYIPTGAAYTPIDPARIVETRVGAKFQTVDDQYEGDGTINTGTTYRVKIAGRGGVDPDATAATLNLTTVAPVAAGFLTIYPCGTQPKASGINYNAGAVVNNEIIAKLSPQGEICIYASAETHLVIDATGWL